MKKKRDSEEKEGCFVTFALFGSLPVIGLTYWLSPETIPFKFLQFWKFNTSLLDAIRHSWVLLVWGTSVNILHAVCTRNKPKENREAEFHLIGGTIVSVWAGVMEEICFRWLIFYGAIVGLQITNLLFFGWAGFGIPQFVYTKAIIPVANFFTFGMLKSILYNGYGWAVGAALISSNGRFRDGHSYQGFFGFTNSWFLGMFFFYLMFNYGLPVAIFIHFLYNFFIYLVGYVDRVVERALGWGEETPPLQKKEIILRDVIPPPFHRKQ